VYAWSVPETVREHVKHTGTAAGATPYELLFIHDVPGDPDKYLAVGAYLVQCKGNGSGRGCSLYQVKRIRVLWME